MTRDLLRSIFFYTTVLIFQLFIFNQFEIFDYTAPSFYLIIFILYKTSYSKTALIILGFITGIIIDLSLQTYGCHTFATITICYLRKWIEKYSFGINSNLPLAMIKGTKLINRITFFILIILIHSLIYYSLIIFNVELLFTIMYSSLINSIFTFILIWLISQILYNR